LSYLTIEKPGAFSPQEASMVRDNNWLFGCDVCQDACPWNRFSKVNNIPELKAKSEFLKMKKDDYNNITEKDFYRIFGDTCLVRTGYEGFVRNYNTLKSPIID
jgi:epoxyqueuosine reductase